jgi:hypothetical protein
MVINDKIYGEQTIDDPLALELLATPAMQRLKEIHQYGVFHKHNPAWNTTRFDHSVGVYLLLKRFDAPREECIAGLLHDVGHMVFSHVMDWMFKRSGQQDSGDNATVAYVRERTVIPEVLEKEGWTGERVFDKAGYPLLEAELPDLCADRIDYSLRDGVTFGLMTPETAQEYLSHLQGRDGVWFFDDDQAAREYAEDVMMLCESFWTAPWQVFMYHLAKEAMARSLKAGAVTQEDFWSDDETVWKKMEGADATVRAILRQIREINKKEINNATGEGEIVYPRKVRVQDPLFKRAGSLERVSEAFPDLAAEFARVKKEFAIPIHFPTTLVHGAGLDETPQNQ